MREGDCERSVGNAMMSATDRRTKLKRSFMCFMGRKSLILFVVCIEAVRESHLAGLMCRPPCYKAAEIANGKDLSRLEATLTPVLKAGANYLEAPDAEEALAAADIIARLGGRFGQQDAYTAAIDERVKRTKLQPSKELLEKARSSIAPILKEPSEIVELWRDSDEFDKWKSSVEELAARLS